MRSSHRRLSGTAITSCARDITSANNDPRQWGLGTTNIAGESYDANNCVKNGWYICNVNTPNGAWWYVFTAANYSNAVIVQKAWYYNYAKDQFGLVTVNIYGIAAQEISAGVDTQIGLLPEGFRPEMQLSSCGWAQTGSAAIVPGAIWVKPNGLINFRSSISVPAGQYIFGQICFLA